MLKINSNAEFKVGVKEKVAHSKWTTHNQTLEKDQLMQ